MLNISIIKIKAVKYSFQDFRQSVKVKLSLCLKNNLFSFKMSKFKICQHKRATITHNNITD